MRSQSSWSERLVDKDGKPAVITCVAFSPDGLQVIVAAGSRIFMYDAIIGEFIKKLKAHKGDVYTVAYSRDGKRFASGSTDKSVIIWTSEGEGQLRINHNYSIQCLAFNPVSHELVSCTESDFGLWNPDQKEVGYTKVQSKILCCSWTNDGQHIALGHMDGRISIRNKLAKEVMVIQRRAPVWTLSWNPSREEQHDILAVGCWDQTLSFYHFPSGKQLKKDKYLGFDPCSLTFFSNGEYMCIGGSDRKVSLWTKEGIRLMTVCETKDWVWSIAHRPHQNYVAIGCNDGLIDVQQLTFNTVHSLYKNLYASRENMTEVVLQDLLSDRKVRIPCKDYVKKIAVYESRLAVQLSDKIAVYDLFENRSNTSLTKEEGAPEEEEMGFQLVEKIQKDLGCNLLIAVSRGVVLCLEQTLQLYDFKGQKQREWAMDSNIRYVKAIGGPPTREGILIGLETGAILKIIIDNPFPVQLLKIGSAVKCLDLSASLTKLAIVDSLNNCIVYDLKSKKFLFQESNANSVSWNSEYEDMLCFSGNGILNIKTDTFPVTQHKFQGVVAGFKGSKIFCLHMSMINTVDIPQSASLFKYLEKMEFSKAYEIACLGVTENDWRQLAMQALCGLNYDVARRSFVRLKDMKFVSLLSKFEKQLNNKTGNEQLFLAEIYAYQGRFDEAARMYVKAGKPDMAMDMLCDMRKWKEAKELAAKTDSVNLRDLIMKQANIAESDKDLKAASELYIAAGEYSKAINIMGEHQWFDSLIEVCRSMDHKSQEGTRAIAICAQYFRKFKHHEYAKEAYAKIGDFPSLLKLHVENQKWTEAFELLTDNQQFAPEVYLPYARYLVTLDRFDEAHEAFRKANQPKEALKILQQMGFNSVIEHRFKDASYYFLQYALEVLSIAKSFDELTEEARDYFESFARFYQFAKMYYAYHYIHIYSELPFNSMEPKYLFNISRYLLMNTLTGDTPYNISKVNIVYAMAKLGQSLENYKLAREAFQRLQTLRVPKHLKTEVDLQSILVNSKPMTNSDELMPVCYRCSSNNPFLSNSGDFCQSCGHPFIRSFYSFSILPLVEFELDDAMTEEEALRLLQSDSKKISSLTDKQTKWRENNDEDENVQTLTFDEKPSTSAQSSQDPFRQALMNSKTVKIKVNSYILSNLPKEEVFVVNWNVPLMKSKFYRNMVPSFPVVHCHSCNMFFHEEDYEFEALKNNGCPFCHASSQ